MSLYDALLDDVRARTGLVFPPSRLSNAEAGIETAMSTLGVSDIESYRQRVRGDESAFEELIAELTVGETYFGRDTDQFAAIRAEILPDLVSRHGRGHAIRTWSAGCATGEEAYSLAIVFAEEQMRSRILATDISPRALVKARAASYGAWSLRGSTPAFRERYFRQLGARFVLNDDVRRRVRFDALNLASDAYPGPFDLILCRNVLIYFDAETIRDVGRRLMRALAPGGWLLLGASDPSLECVDGVERVGPAAYRSGGQPAEAPRFVEQRSSDVLSPMPVMQFEAAAPPPPPNAPPASPHTKIEEIRRAADASRSADVLELATRAIEQFPLCAELHLLYAFILLDLGNDAVAETALRRALFLDRSLAAAHFALGTLLQRRGDDGAAERAFRNALAASTLPHRSPVSLGSGTTPDEIRFAAELALRGMEHRP